MSLALCFSLLIDSRKPSPSSSPLSFSLSLTIYPGRDRQKPQETTRRKYLSTDNPTSSIIEVRRIESPPSRSILPVLLFHFRCNVRFLPRPRANCSEFPRPAASLRTVQPVSQRIGFFPFVTLRSIDFSIGHRKSPRISAASTCESTSHGHDDVESDETNRRTSPTSRRDRSFANLRRRTNDDDFPFFRNYRRNQEKKFNFLLIKNYEHSFDKSPKKSSL